MEAPTDEWCWVNFRLLAGKYPGSRVDAGAAADNVNQLIDAGVRTFIDLTEDGEPLGTSAILPDDHPPPSCGPRTRPRPFAPLRVTNKPYTGRTVPRKTSGDGEIYATIGPERRARTLAALGVTSRAGRRLLHTAADAIDKEASQKRRRSGDGGAEGSSLTAR